MTQKRGKHLLNSLESAVEDNLHGYALLHRQLQYVPGLNLILSKAVFNEDDGADNRRSDRKVGLLAGAGSGHEPVMHGYVGVGGLDISVAGQVFASPSSGQVMEALRLLSHHYSDILIIVNNYTGDRLNFGLAAERAKIELGIGCRLFCFGDDVAFCAVKNAKTGRRGLAGGVLLGKCLGALADKGLTLDQLFSCAESMAARIATMSVSLTSCDVPGSGSSFTLADNELELGLGIHGEPGVRRTNSLLTSREAVHTILESIVSVLQPVRGSRVALLVNNIGGLSNFDLNVVTRDAIIECKERGLIMERLLVGDYCTSFSMTGVSLSLMLLDDETLELLDADCDVPAFSSSSTFLQVNPDPEHHVLQSDHELGHDWVTVPGLKKEHFMRMVKAAAEAMIEAEELLNDLDRCGGDADCGLTARKGAAAIIRFMDETKQAPSFLDLAAITSQEMGGTSGAIYSLLFTSVHSSLKSLDEKRQETSLQQRIEFWAHALETAIQTVTRYSWAEPGDRTMLDTVHAVQQLLLHQIRANGRGSDILRQVASAATSGADATATMDARAGRSSYASEDTIGSQADAGAVGVAVWINAAIKAFSQFQ